jgi:nitroreductase
MNLTELIETRRSYRSLVPVEINENIIRELALSAGLAPSCFNHQPWRFVFVHEKENLERMFEALSQGNSWAKHSSMIVAVFSNQSLDCMLPEDRYYYQFDTGMATGFMLLKATELGLVAHPIAGYDENKVREILEIPADMRVITLIIVGKQGDAANPVLNDKQIDSEKKRPERLGLEKFIYMESFKKTLGT